jgi:hypothetical protein
MVSSVQESEWDEEQLAWVEAERLVRNLLGPNGEWLPDATAPVTEQMANRYRWVTEGPFTNQAEKMRLDAIEAHRKAQGKDANLNGVYFTVKRDDY